MSPLERILVGLDRGVARLERFAAGLDRIAVTLAHIDRSLGKRALLRSAQPSARASTAAPAGAGWRRPAAGTAVFSRTNGGPP